MPPSSRSLRLGGKQVAVAGEALDQAAIAAAIREAGYEPEVQKVHGLGVGPKLFQHKTEGRKEVEQLTGSPTVPVLVTDSGEVISDSKEIVAWAEANPASVPVA